MFRDFEEEAMGGEKQIFVDVAMVIKTMLLNPGRFTILHVDTFLKNSLRLFPYGIMNLRRPRWKLL